MPVAEKQQNPAPVLNKPSRLDPTLLEEIADYMDKLKRYKREEEIYKKDYERYKKGTEIALKSVKNGEERLKILMDRNSLLKKKCYEYHSA